MKTLALLFLVPLIILFVFPAFQFNSSASTNITIVQTSSNTSTSTGCNISGFCDATAAFLSSVKSGDALIAVFFAAPYDGDASTYLSSFNVHSNVSLTWTKLIAYNQTLPSPPAGGLGGDNYGGSFAAIYYATASSNEAVDVNATMQVTAVAGCTISCNVAAYSGLVIYEITPFFSIYGYLGHGIAPYNGVGNTVNCAVNQQIPSSALIISGCSWGYPYANGITSISYAAGSGYTNVCNIGNPLAFCSQYGDNLGGYASQTINILATEGDQMPWVDVGAAFQTVTAWNVPSSSGLLASVEFLFSLLLPTMFFLMFAIKSKNPNSFVLFMLVGLVIGSVLGVIMNFVPFSLVFLFGAILAIYIWKGRSSSSESNGQVGAI